MAIVWGDDYKIAHISRGAGGGQITVATKNDVVYFKRNTDDGWIVAPVEVGTIESGGRACHTWYDGKYVWVTNGTTHIWRSSDYGVTWSAA